LDKAPDAFRTISEVADDLDIPQHVLRFWETRFTQIKPMKRSGGRRYYRPDDVDLLRGIRRLLYGEGYTIRGVQRILKENGIKAVQGLVDELAAPAFAPVRASEPRMSPAAPAMTPPKARPHVIDDAPEDEEDEVEDELEAADDEGESDADTEDAEQDESDAEAEDDDAEDAASDDEDGAEDEEEEQEDVAPVAARKAPDIVPRREPDLRPPAARAPEIRPNPAIAATPRIEPRLQQAIGRTDPASMSRANPAATARTIPAAPPPMNAHPAPQPEPPARGLDRERLQIVLEELLAARRALDAAMKDGGT
jgi:DNA-binding transcriptional MerR regulator